MRRTTIYIPDDLHREFKIYSAGIGVSMSEVLIDAIMEILKGRVRDEDIGIHKGING